MPRTHNPEPSSGNHTIRRDANGHYLPGESGNRKGRATFAKESAYLKTLQSCVTLDDWIEVAEKALEQAKKGSWRAREWLARYICPDPIPEKSDGPVRLQIAYVNNWRQPQLEEGASLLIESDSPIEVEELDEVEAGAE